MADQPRDDHALLAERAAKDAFMGEDPNSPLAHEQRHAFTGLAYYPPNPALRLELPLDRDGPHDAVTLETSTGESQQYQRAGKIQFSVEGAAAELTLYQAENGALFLPLRDATSGDESYGAGRYLEPTLLDSSRVLVDFNYLYNPYCAYSEAWSCPLPPRENWLGVPLRAGEKRFPTS